MPAIQRLGILCLNILPLSYKSNTIVLDCLHSLGLLIQAQLTYQIEENLNATMARSCAES